MFLDCHLIFVIVSSDHITPGIFPDKPYHNIERVDTIYSCDWSGAKDGLFGVILSIRSALLGQVVRSRFNLKHPSGFFFSRRLDELRCTMSKFKFTDVNLSRVNYAHTLTDD